MSALKFADRFADAGPDIRLKAPVLRVILLVVMVLLPIIAVSDFLTGDVVNAAAELVVFFLFAFAFLLLGNGRYDASTRTAAASAFVMVLIISFLAKEPSENHLFRNGLLFVMAISFGSMFLTDRRILVAFSIVGGLGHLAFSFFRILPTGVAIGALLGMIVVGEALYALACFFILKASGLSWAINAELDEERRRGAERVEKLSSVVAGARANMESLGLISARVEEIRRLIAAAGDAVQAIEVRIGELERASGESSEAANRIAERITDLNRNIEDESAAQVESSASINEMVASIQSVADSATRRRASMQSLAGTADEGMSRLDALLALIAKIEGSIGSIQSMVKVINSIAGSTNLLSMNAAIEAAHAGDAGRGFAVVAEEIRKLADTAGKNSKEIGRQLKEVIGVITGAAEESGRTREAFAEIRSEIDGAMDAFQEITAATGELAEGGRQILDALKTLSEMSGSVRSGGGEISEAQKTLVKVQAATQDALSALRTEAEIVKEKDQEVLVAAELVAKVGEDGTRLAEELHRRSEAAGV